MRLPLTNIVQRLCGVHALVRSTVNRGMAHTPSIDPLGRIVWVDMELTGLDPEKDMILEVACIVTEANLDEVGGRVNLVINQPDDVLQNMGEWCQETHRRTGLYDEVVRSTLTVQEADTRLLEHLEKYTDAGSINQILWSLMLNARALNKGEQVFKHVRALANKCLLVEHFQKTSKCCLAGNTVYMDRLFLAKYMPKVNNHLHYRIIDVSSIKELVRRWNREIYLNAPQKCFIHRALEDIIESIAELKHYKHTLFNVNSKPNT